MYSGIIKVACHLPEQVLTNQMLAKTFVDWDETKIEEKTGIRERRIAGTGETSADLGFQAAEKVLEGYDRQKIDFVLFCTQSPDFFLPTSACLLQNRLQLRQDCGALDINLGCSGFIYGLFLADSMIRAGNARCVLLITAETYSKMIHPQDRSNRTIFGDAAAATIIAATEAPGIHKFILGTDGNGGDRLILKNGGFRNRACVSGPGTAGRPDEGARDDYLFMDGPEIFNFTIKAVPKVVRQVLEINQTSWEEIDYVIFHQANKFMIEYLRKKIGIPEKKFCVHLEKTGNTVSSTIPIALKASIDQGTIQPGNRVLLVGFGVGYSWGGVLITL